MIIRRLLIYLLVLACYPAIFAQNAPQLSEKAVVSVLTCDPGAEIYEVYGHSAFRVRDPEIGLDKAYNYGTFEFGPGFEMQFVRGKLRYFLNSYSFRRFMAEYQHYNRTVKEQVLNLNSTQRQEIFNYLVNNERPENKYYQYDFFYDNCSTRERDVIANVLGDQLQYHPPKDLSYGSLRDLIHIYQAVMPWTSFGIDMFLGMPADKEATQQDAMFLPDYMFNALRTAKVKVNGNWENLVAHEAVLFKAPPVTVEEPGWLGPILACWLLFGVGCLLTFTNFGRKRVFRLFDTLLFSTVGLLGLIMLMFMLATDHQATYWNLNLVWALPTHFIFAFLLWSRKADWILFRYATWTGFLYLGFLALNWFLPQDFHPAVYPLVILMLFRMMLYRFRSID